MSSALDTLQSIGKEVEREFSANKRVLSFAEYLELVSSNPQRHLRSSAGYLRDAFDYYGTESVAHPKGEIRRFRLFDAPWAAGEGGLAGQEEVQNRIYRVLDNFIKQHRVDRFLLLHGPNGSSKSTITELLARALENYSKCDEGTLYRFNWIFPSRSVEHAGIGFGSGGDKSAKLASDSFAHLDPTAIDALLPCETRDHPLLLIPRPQRQALLKRFAEEHGIEFPTYLVNGNLSHKNKQIYETLLTSYEGDYLRVLRHIQVERFYVSRRYRVGAARVEPQMAVDAHTRQVTADRSLAALPPMLQNLSLYELDGQLVRANRGVLDFADMFKRPLEASKYLLTAVESGHVALDTTNLFFDIVFVGSVNEMHLNALMETPDWMSFKARFELVRVPYLRDYNVERQIYIDQLTRSAPGKSVAPLTADVAALWAVLTRLRKPNPDRYPESIRPTIAKMTPLDKALLYSEGQLPEGISGEIAKELRSAVSDIFDETVTQVPYEGRTGASVREIKTLLLNAAQDDRFACMSPTAVLRQVEGLVRQTSVYEFLRQSVQDPGYHDHKALIEVVRGWFLDQADAQCRVATGLVEEASYAELFSRYIDHVTHHVRKEKLRNPVTGDYDAPDQKLMGEVESNLDVADGAEEFRQGLMTRIGAWSIDHQGDRPSYIEIFPELFARLKEHYYAKVRRRVAKMIQHALNVLSEEGESVPADEREEVKIMISRLQNEYGYDQICAKEMLTEVLKHRYSDLN